MLPTFTYFWNTSGVAYSYQRLKGTEPDIWVFEAPEKIARKIMEEVFDRDPDGTACDSCGSDFSISSGLTMAAINNLLERYNKGSKHVIYRRNDPLEIKIFENNEQSDAKNKQNNKNKKKAKTLQEYINEMTLEEIRSMSGLKSNEEIKEYLNTIISSL